MQKSWAIVCYITNNYSSGIYYIIILYYILWKDTISQLEVYKPFMKYLAFMFVLSHDMIGAQLNY